METEIKGKEIITGRSWMNVKNEPWTFEGCIYESVNKQGQCSIAG